MKSRADIARVGRGVLLAALASSVSLADAVRPAAADERQFASYQQEAEGSSGRPAPIREEKAPDAAGSQGGMWVYIDPQTGAILTEPAPGTVPLQLTPDLRSALSTSHDGLVEVPSPAPGGGVFIDLQGRFQSPVFAIIGADGKVRIRHLPETPEATKEK